MPDFWDQFLQQKQPLQLGTIGTEPLLQPQAQTPMQSALQDPYGTAGRGIASLAGKVAPLLKTATPYLKAAWEKIAPYAEQPSNVQWPALMQALKDDPNIDPVSKVTGVEVLNQIASSGTPVGLAMGMIGLGPVKKAKKAADVFGEAAGVAQTAIRAGEAAAPVAAEAVEALPEALAAIARPAKASPAVVDEITALFPRLDAYSKPTGRLTADRIRGRLAAASGLSPEARQTLEQVIEQVGTRRVGAEEVHALAAGKAYKPERTIRRVTAIKEGAEQIPGAPIGITNARQERALRERYLDTIERGAGGREWYHDSGKDILSYANDDPSRANLVAGDLAITSPATSVSANTSMGVKGYNQATAGVPVSAGRFPTAMGKAIEEAHAAGGAGDIGLKRSPFQQNVARGGGFNVSTDPPRAVHDIWDGEAWGFMNPDGTPMRQGFSPAQHKWMDKQQDLMLKEANKRRIGGHDNWEELRSQAAAWTGQQIKAGVLDPADAAKSYADHLKGLVAQGSRETVPGRTTGHMPELLRPEAEAERQLLHDMVMKESGIYDEKGRDQIAAGYGGLVGRSFDAPGVFEGSISPGRQTQVLTGSLEDPSVKGARVLDEGSRRIMDASEATHGLLMGQDASAYSRVLPSGSGVARNAWDVSLPGGTVTEAHLRDLAKRLGKDISDMILVPTPDGIRLSGMDEKTAKTLVKALGGKIKEAGSLQGNYLPNDWQTSRVGQDYLEPIRTMGAEKFDRFAPGIAERLRGIDARFAKETGGRFTLSPAMDEIRATIANEGFAGLERLAKKYGVSATALAAALTELQGEPRAGSVP